jgi:hypothetical protein
MAEGLHSLGATPIEPGMLASKASILYLTLDFLMKVGKCPANCHH